VGITQGTVWIHNEKGNREASSEGYGFAPQLSPDGKTLYYLQTNRGKSGASNQRSSEGMQLMRFDGDSGTSEPLLPGVGVIQYQVSNDGKMVVYSRPYNSQQCHLWVASLDRRFAPQQISFGADDSPALLPSGDIVFRGQEKGAYYIYIMKVDGSGRRKLFAVSVIGLQAASPDGQWIVVWQPLKEAESNFLTQAYRLADGKTVRICNFCLPGWSPSGKYFYVSVDSTPEVIGKTYALPLAPGSMLPRLPPGGFTSDDQLKKLTKIVLPLERASDFSPGPSPQVYAFGVQTIQRNLYRIPLEGR
jgi:Tol biopolymer transport system component